MAQTHQQKRATGSPAIPDRLYFKIGDVARICEVEPYVLRFWESQFPQLKPNKSGAGQRLYRRKDVETALEIKRLVHGTGYTLAGARQVLEHGNRRAAPQLGPPVAGEPAGTRNQEQVAAIIGHARAELREIAELLGSPNPQRVRGTARHEKVTPMRPTTGSLFPA